MRNLRESVPLPYVSAESWLVYDVDSQKPLAGKLMNFKREIASLTKMMTFLVSWQLFQEYFPEVTSIRIEVPSYCTQVQGTSAYLLAKDVLTLHELFYALLLPSGNDAALVLADYFGSIVWNKQKVTLPKSNQFQDNLNVRYFLREMNLLG